VTTSEDQLLDQAVKVASDAGADLTGYTFAPVNGATQATVWKGTSPMEASADVALRLTPKPVELITRIAAAIECVGDVVRPRTLAVGQLPDGDRWWTVHLCAWIGTGAPARPDMRLLGQHLARLHLALAESSLDVTDRRLTFERSPGPAPDHDLPSWDIARHVWRDRVHAWVSLQSRQDLLQPIHGDLHWANVVATSTGFGFIDFDKLAFAPPVFDLAKLIATGMFSIGERAQFHAGKVTELLQGYESLRPLTDIERAALEGAVILLNAETARLGALYNIEGYRTRACAIGDWWITRCQRARHDPLAVRSGRRAESQADDKGLRQMTLWSDEAGQPAGRG